MLVIRPVVLSLIAIGMWILLLLLSLLLALLSVRRLRLRLQLGLMLLLLILLTTEVTASTAALPVPANIASSPPSITLCAGFRMVWDEIPSAGLEPATVRISAARKAGATASWLLCSIIGGVVDSNCAAVESSCHQQARHQGGAMAILSVVHADKSIVGFCFVCEANESKAPTSLRVSILHNNLADNVNLRGHSRSEL